MRIIGRLQSHSLERLNIVADSPFSTTVVKLFPANSNAHVYLRPAPGESLANEIHPLAVSCFMVQSQQANQSMGRMEVAAAGNIRKGWAAGDRKPDQNLEDWRRWRPTCYS